MSLLRIESVAVTMIMYSNSKKDSFMSEKLKKKIKRTF